MPNTSERGEITARANAKEAETVRQSQKLTSKTKQLSALNNAKSRLRRARTLRVRPRNLLHGGNLVGRWRLATIPKVVAPMRTSAGSRHPVGARIGIRPADSVFPRSDYSSGRLTAFEADTPLG